MRREVRDPLPDHAGESTFLSRSGGEKWLIGSGARNLGVPLEGTRRVGGLLGVAGRLSGTVSPFRAEHGTSLETPGTSVFTWSETGMLGNFGVTSRVPSSISNFKMERGTSLETLAGKGLILR